MKTDTMVRLVWVLTFFILVWGTPPSGGYVLGKNNDDDALDPGGGREWSVEDPLFQAALTLDANEDEPLDRHIRAAEDDTTEAPVEDTGSKSFWQKVEEFYSDNNNMAMYCVLPVIVLVYGGCSAIYCIHKCRRHLRRRKHKRLHNEDDTSSLTDERNDLNQHDAGGGQPVKTVSGSTWDDANTPFNDVRYNVERKKTPLPWDMPQNAAPVIGVAAANKTQMQRQDSFSENDGKYSATSRGSSTAALERERDKLEHRLEPPKPGPKPDNLGQRPPVNKANDFSRFAGSRPIEIVPISKAEYQRQMEKDATGDIWDPLHNRPFDSRNSGDLGRKTGRESAWSIRDEIMAKYDALTSLAMAKKTAEVLRVNANNHDDDGGHHPDTLRRKAKVKQKLIFIAE